MPTFNWIFENQRIASGISTQPSRFKRAENTVLADKKSHQQRYVIHLYLEIYYLLLDDELRLHE